MEGFGLSVDTAAAVTWGQPDHARSGCCSGCLLCCLSRISEMTSVAAVLRDSHSLLPNWSKLLKDGEGGRYREGGSLLIRLRSSTTPTQRPYLFYSVLTNELLQKHLGSSIKDKNDFFFCSVVYWLASQRSLLFKSAAREPEYSRLTSGARKRLRSEPKYSIPMTSICPEFRQTLCTI